MAKNERIIDVGERDHNRILKDIEFIVGLSDEELSQQAKYDVLYKISWEWTEGQKKAKKYFGCEYWSEKALERKYGKDFLKNIESQGFITTKSNDKGLRHEHVVPKKLFMEYVWAIVTREKDFNEKTLRELMEQNLLACVITADEDKVLSKYKISEKLPEKVKLYSTEEVEKLTAKKIDDIKVKFFENIEVKENIDDTLVWNRYKIAQQGDLSTIYKVEWDTNDTKNITKITQYLPKPNV